MTLFQVKQRSTGVLLWVGPADSKGHALDVMARQAGFRDAAHLPVHVRYGGFRTARVVS